MARNHFTFEKRRRELEKKKKKEAKRQARQDKKAELGEGEEADVVVEKGPPIAQVDQFGIPIEPDDDAFEDETDD